jgi:spermidine synthase
MPDFTETLYDGFGQTLRIDEMLFEAKSDHQHIVIFKNTVFGRVLALDGVVQTTAKDEFIYHEMLAHVPIFAHGQAKEVLIVGGGDGGMLREVVRHRDVEQITQVEIDRQVIDMCREYLPGHSDGAFDDRRVKIVIDDGLNFVHRTAKRFDVIISDSTDPIGPGEALFGQDFYSACKGCLNPGGILVTQNGVAFMQPAEVETTALRLRRTFGDWHFFAAAVPTYVGGIMAFGWASDEPNYRRMDLDTLRSRYRESGIPTRYYNPEIHLSAFALPQYLLHTIGKANNQP